MANNGTITHLINGVTQISKSNKYRIIINVVDAEGIDILCTSASMNGMLSTPLDVWYRGRKAQVRGESGFNQTWSIEFYNNVDLGYRHKFIQWMRDIHHSRVNETGALEAAVPAGLLGDIKSAYGNITKAVQDIKGVLADGGKGFLQGVAGVATPQYQGEAKIFQLDANGNESYHQTLVGLFPVEVSNVDFADNNQELTSTTVTFAFSDIIYADENGGTSVTEGLLGSTVAGLF